MVDILDSFGLSQHIDGPTHTQGHTLDWLISRTENDIVSQCVIDEFVSDHSAIKAYLNIKKSKYSRKKVTFRKYKSINLDAFKQNLEQLELILSPSDTLDGLVSQYNNVLLELINKHAPLKTMQITDRPKVPWINSEFKEAKIKRRKLEKEWRKNKTVENRKRFNSAKIETLYIQQKAKEMYYLDKIEKCGKNQKLQAVAKNYHI